MKGSSIIYILILALLVSLLVYANSQVPEPVSWERSLTPTSTQPYGLVALETLISDLFPEQEISRNHNSIFESIADGKLDDGASIFSLSNQFSTDASEAEILLDHVKEGNQALLVADEFDYGLLSLLGLEMTDDGLYSPPIKLVNGAWEGDSIRISWVQEDSIHFYFPRSLFGYAFDIESYNAIENLHSSPLNQNRIKPNTEEVSWEMLSKDFGFDVLACNDAGNPVVINIAHGKGNLILCTVPLAFTNYFLLKTNNHPLASATLSLLHSDRPMAWSEYYQLGREESSNPLRVIASDRNLRFAWYLILGTGLLFMVFKGKRKQRIIPIIKPPRNDTLDFVTTIGHLYHERGNHTDLAKKKVTFWQEHIRSHYFMDARELNEDFAKKLANKAGKEESEMIRLVKMARSVQERPNISEAELRVFNKHLENFYA